MHLLPTRVTFPGMPAERFWEFEDAAVDLGAVTAAAEDLGRLLAVEFATVFGNDWWSVPVPARLRLARRRAQPRRARHVRRERPRRRRTDAAARDRAVADVPPRPIPALAAGSGPAPALLLLAPVVAGALDGDPIEELLLLRDEMANLAWAVERVVEGADGRPRNRSTEYGSRLTAAPPPSSPRRPISSTCCRPRCPSTGSRSSRFATPAGRAAVVLQRGSLLTQDG